MPWRTPPVDLDPPDISPHRAGNTGIDYVTSYKATEPGPHVMLNALTHGNEICGAIILDELMKAGLRPARGTLTFSFANVAAYQSFSAKDPLISRYLDEDFNRIWDDKSLAGPRRSREMARAQVMRPIVDTVDILLDIHSTSAIDLPMMLTGWEEKHLAFARRMGVPELLVRDSGHVSGKRLRDYGRFNDPAAAPIALLVESGQHWAKESVAIAREATWRFLATAGVLSDADAAPWREPPTTPTRTILVTDRISIQTDDFQFAQAFNGFDILPHKGTLVARDGRTELRTPYDNCVLVMPAKRPSRGHLAVRLGRFED